MVKQRQRQHVKSGGSEPSEERSQIMPSLLWLDAVTPPTCTKVLVDITLRCDGKAEAETACQKWGV